MNILTSALLFASSLVATVSAENIIIQSYCPFPVYFVHDVSTVPATMGLVTVLQQGQTFPYSVIPNKPGALKFAKDWPQNWSQEPGALLVGGLAINQFEFNYETNYLNKGKRNFQYNWSNMDCQGHQANTGGECPFTAHGMVAERKGCTTFECKPGDRDCKQCYQAVKDDANIGCDLGGLPLDFHLTLCSHNARSANLRRSRIWPGDDKVSIKEGNYIVKQPINSTQLI